MNTGTNMNMRIGTKIDMNIKMNTDINSNIDIDIDIQPEHHHMSLHIRACMDMHKSALRTEWCEAASASR